MTRSRLTALVSLLFVTIALSGCADAEGPAKVASAGGGPSPSAAAVDTIAQMREYAKCMRDNGIDMPDPNADGVSGLPGQEVGSDTSKLDAAVEKCRSLLPADTGRAAKMSAEDLTKMRALSKCMRENGMADYPDPDPETGEVALTEESISGEAMGKAAEKCRGVGPGAVRIKKAD
ncbi:hypothetical protein [Actinoplanes sp. M2I2]|uniref:hypothetical protein n=1 Tax=Actinoplanes sp. M2I2 TaxID=1734444 RepID=UPI002020D01F|nr:hypothetical protein [Actinoplanes sp. M2I2]